MKIINKIIVLGIILLCGSTIKKTIEQECPDAYNQYLKDRREMPFYRRWMYMK